MKIRSISSCASAALVGVGCLFGATSASAQAVPLPVEMEGLLQNFRLNNNNGVQIDLLNVMGVPLRIGDVPAENISTPTTSFADYLLSHPGATLEDWFLGGTLPGRNLPGFRAGTAIVTGEVDPDTRVITVDTVFSEPAENVVLGMITAARCTSANCDAPGDYIRMLDGRNPNNPNGLGALTLTEAATDGRLFMDAAIEANGFALDLTGFGLIFPADGLGAALEGYYSDFAVSVPDVLGPGVNNERVLYYFAMEMDVVPFQLIANQSADVSVARAQCRQRDVNEFEIEVRGGTHITFALEGVQLPDEGQVDIIDAADVTETSIVLDNAIVPTAEAGDPNFFGGYRALENAAGDDRLAGTCPTEVIAIWTVNGVERARSAPFEVDIRDDTAG